MHADFLKMIIGALKSVVKYRLKAPLLFNTIVILRPKVITNLTGIHYSFFIPSRLEPVCRDATTLARLFLFSPVWI